MIQHILVPVDFSDITETLVDKARELGSALKASICLLHIEPEEPELASYKPGPEYAREDMPQKRAEFYRHLNDYKDRLRAQGIDAKAVLLQGDTVDKILQEARQFKAELIMLGSHGNSALHDLLLGSVSEGVLHQAPCPVMVIHSRSSQNQDYRS